MSKATRVMLAFLTTFVVIGAMAIGAASAQDTMKKDATKKADEKKGDMMKSGGSADSKFVMEAAQGGMMEVQLGQVAASKATADSVKQFGQRMVDDHSKANTELMQLASSKNITLSTTLDAKHQAMLDKLSKLSGADFDRQYMSMMVKDHNEDVAAFEKEANNGKDPDVKAWAAKTLPTLKEHQTMAKSIADGMGHTAGTMKHGM